MVKVAIAGGTGGVGRAIAEVLRDNPNHQGIILSRQAKQTQDYGLPLVQAEYSDVNALKDLLERHEIHTVICTFAIEGSSLAVAQRNLIQASAMSSTTRRFIPTSFGIPYPRDYVRTMPPLRHYFQAIEDLQKTDLQWAVVLNGTFLDYFGMPHLKSYLKPNVFVIDMENKVAGIPGTGDDVVTFTYSFDVAKFVVAALDLEEWPHELRVVGDSITWNQLVRLAEEVRSSKFDIYYDDVETLKTFQITELPAHRDLYNHFPKERFQWFMSIFELWTASGISCIPIQGALNEKFPDIKPLTVRELLEKFWKGK